MLGQPAGSGRGPGAGRQKGKESFHGASLSISLGSYVSKRLLFLTEIIIVLTQIIITCRLYAGQ